MVVRRLHRGLSLFPLYNDEPTLLSKTTAFKLKRLYEQGELDFMVQEILLTDVVDNQYPFTGESHEERIARELAQRQEDQSELQESFSRIEPKPVQDHHGFHRWDVIDELPTIDWSISGLEQAHISEENALSVLSEYDELNIKCANAEIKTWKRDEYEEEFLSRWMADFRGIDRYVALHYLVQFSSRHENAPFQVLDRAATLYAKGLLGLDSRLEAAGANLVRYQVWRGQEYLDAYLESTKKYYETKRRRDRLAQEVSAILGKNP